MYTPVGLEDRTHHPSATLSLQSQAGSWVRSNEMLNGSGRALAPESLPPNTPCETPGSKYGLTGNP